MKWWWKRRSWVEKQGPPGAPVELTLEVAADIYKKFAAGVQGMTEAINALAIACAQVSASIDADCKKITIVYNTTNMRDQ